MKKQTTQQTKTGTASSSLLLGKITIAILSFLILTGTVLTSRAQTIWDAGSALFIYTGSGDEDVITASTHLTRSTVLYNAACETIAGQQNCNLYDGPCNTEWSYGNIVDWNTLTYGSWLDMNGCAPPSMVGQPAVCHIISDDIYFQVIFISWNPLDNQPFAYIRTYTEAECIPPTVSCPGNMSAFNDAGVCNAMVSYSSSTTGTTPIMTYEFTGATTDSGLGDGSGSAFNPGTTTVTLAIGNGCGTNTCSFDVTVTENEAPVADMGSLPDVTDECSATISTMPTATDNCSGSITGTTSDPLTYNTQGTFMVTWTYDDGNNNMSTQTQNVIVMDMTAPVADMGSLPDVTDECSATVTTMPTATDNCSGSITGTTSDPLTYNTQGTFMVTWTYDDGNGNSSTQTQNVIVDDVTAPATPTLANVTGECSATATAPTTTDNCAGTITGTTTDALSYSTQGTHVITWTFDDGNGQSVTATQNVIVDDVTAPATPTLADVTGECSATATAPTTTDNCAGTITGTTTDALSYSTQGTHVITWTFDDGNGQSVTATQNVIVDDVTAPAAPTLADVTGECSATATAPTTTDNCAGTITGTTTDALSYSTQGTHVITWTFDDGNGQSVTATQNVIVDDVTAPATPTLADVTGECSATATAPTTTDNCAGIIAGTTTDALSYSTQGTHVITWTFDDGNGQSVTATQNVIVDDVTAPATPTLADVTGECSATATAPTTTDNCAGTITGTTTDALSYSTQGTHVITWTFDDGNGQSVTATQNVIVDDVTAPATPTLADVTGECSATATAPTTTDNCAGIIAGTTTDALSYSTQGTHVITWTFDDGNGQSVTATQNVIVDDVTAPATPTLADVTGECSATATAPTTTDNCTGTITGTTTDALSYSTQGTHVITWTFDDGNGQSVTATQNVIINDVTLPTITAPADVTTCTGSTVVLGTPVTADNCTVASVTNNHPSSSYGLGTTVVMWTVTDGAGNMATANQNVIVNSAPVGSASSIVICDGDPSNLPLSSTIVGTTFTWTSAVITGTVMGNGSCSSGCTSTISDLLSNIGTVHGVVQYSIVPTAPGGCVGATFTATVTVGAAPAAPVISGPSVVCGFSTTTYSCPLVPEATSYIWTVPTGVTGMTITGGQGTNAITVSITAGTVTGFVTCTAHNNCGNSPTTSMAVTKKPATPGAISGPTSTCGLTSATYSIATVFGATSYAWTVPANMTITSGQGGLSINVSMTSAFVYGQVKVSAVNACGNIPGTASTVTGNVPSTPVAIAGPTNVCGLTTASYSISAVAGATGYNWTITGAGTIIGSNTGTSVNVALNGTTGGSISCASTNVCGNGTPRTLNLVVAAIQAGAIGGPTSICGMGTASWTVASVGTNYTYNWSLTMAGWSITSGQGTTTITAVGPASGTTSTGQVQVRSLNSCGLLSLYRSMSVTYCHNGIAMNNGVEATGTTFSNIYPNPTASDFTIDVISTSSTTENQEVTVEVYDVLGNLVIHAKHQLVSGTITMKTNIEDFENGMYFVRLLDVDSNVIHSQTVIKQ